MKRLISILLCMLLVLGFTACGGSADTEETQSETSAQAEATEATQTQADKDVLVVYFSATGTTKGVAEKIASITGADMYEILAAQPYSEEDLDYNNEDSRTTKEMNDPEARPEIGSEDISLEGYKTVYIGYPIWHGQAPRIMSTFVEGHNFEGIKVIPFCTSGSSGIGDSAVTLEDQAGTGSWLEGERFDGSVSEDELESWIGETK